MGNVTLAAWDDAGTGLAIRAVTLLAGGAIALATVVACVRPPPYPSDCGTLGDVGLGTAVVVAVGGAVAGVGYDLATIPRNAARARERRRSAGDVQVVFVPMPQAAALGLRVRL